MAIFHLNESNISRSDGRSAVACAAYRACEKLEDLTFGKTQDYTKKNGLAYKNIYAPEHTDAKLLDRQTLWNTVEKKEFNADGSMKANARLAKEYTCALPHELTDQERIKIVDDFCRNFVKKHNVIVDACIHAPHEHHDETHNKNYHVHIMFTTRLVNEKGELGKKQRTFNDHGPEILKDSRATFASVVNTELIKAGLDERVDHRSYKDQGLDFLQATTHEGHEVTALRRQGIDTEISLNNDAIKAKNLEAAREYQQIFKDLDQEIIIPSRLEAQIADLEEELRLTEEEEQACLAELANLDRQEEQLQAQQVQQIDSAYDDFINYQNVYADFAKTSCTIHNEARKIQQQIEDNFNKTERWLIENKREFFRDKNGAFFDAYHYTSTSVKLPDFYTTEKSKNSETNENWRSFASKLERLSAEFDIENIINRLRECAEILNNCDIELPTTKPTFWQKLKGQYIHSFDTLSDFDKDIKPILNEKKADDLRLDREIAQNKLKQEIESKERKAQQRWEDKCNEERRLRVEAAEREMKKEREEMQHKAFLEQEAMREKERNEPKKQDNRKDSDYTPF